tara:strand:+ start:177 stop:332 length:156 start_codon:yes stop_codon:yes gene_type:complete
MKEIICGYRIAGKLAKGDFKRLTIGVIDFDKVLTWMYLGSVWNGEPVPLSL